MRVIFALMLSATLANAETIGDVYLLQAAKIAADKQICHMAFQYYEFMNLVDKVAVEFHVSVKTATDMIADKATEIGTPAYCASRRG